jgi:hypothetical protein
MVTSMETRGTAMMVDSDLTVTMNQRAPLRLLADARMCVASAGSIDEAISTSHPTAFMPLFEHRILPCEHIGGPTAGNRSESAG